MVLKCFNKAHKDGYLQLECKIVPTKIKIGGNLVYRVYCPDCLHGSKMTSVSYEAALTKQKQDIKNFLKINVESGFKEKIAEEYDIFLKTELAKLPAYIRKDPKRKGEATNKINEDFKKKKEKQIKTDVEFEERKKLFGEDAAKKWLEIAKKTGVKLELPTPTYTEYIKKAQYTLYWVFGGIVISAFTANPGFLFAALSFGFASLIPNPENIAAVREQAKKLKEEFEKKMATADEMEEGEEKSRQIDRITKTYEARVKIENLIAETRTGKDPRSIAQFLYFKQIFRAIGFLILVITLLIGSSIIPFSGLTGLILGFIGFFSFGGEQRAVDKEG